MASIQKRKGKNKWRARYRDGGRDTPDRYGEWRSTLGEAEADLELIEERQEADKPLAGRLVIPWSECRSKWLKTLSGRYQQEAKRTLKRHTAKWKTTKDATASAMAELPLGTALITRACLRWSWLHLGQQLDQRVLHVAPKRYRARRVIPALLDKKEVVRLIAEASEWAPANGAIAHLVATYGHRAESLVGLTEDNFPGDEITLTVKSGEIVRHRLLPATLALLKPLRQGRGKPMFLNHLGKPWASGQEFASWFGHQLGTGYYNLKRFGISRMLNAGLDAKTIASITGHKTVSLLLNTYAQTNEQRQKQAITTLGRLVRPGVSKAAAGKS